MPPKRILDVDVYAMSRAERAKALKCLYAGIRQVCHRAAASKNICWRTLEDQLYQLVSGRGKAGTMDLPAPTLLCNCERYCASGQHLWRLSPGRHPDVDMQSMPHGTLGRNIMRARKAILRIRSAANNPRCWIPILRDLPALLPEARTARRVFRSADKCLLTCQQYIACQQKTCEHAS